ncbi:MAG TPA: hypothetical protein VFO62_10540 [Candidatus Binatia bacterium]|nr:hypothetical protein [Candidatus Binatia bacterium]
MAIKPYVMRRELMAWPGLSAYPAQWRYGVYATTFRDRKNGGKP